MANFNLSGLKNRWPQNSCQNFDQSEFIITTFEKCSSQMKKGRRQNNLGASVDMLYYIFAMKGQGFQSSWEVLVERYRKFHISLFTVFYSKN